MRFWRSVAKSDDGCWLWTASLNTWGYGQIRDENGEYAGAHIISWRLHNGPIPDGQEVLHTCDTPACVRPDHLFIGTQAVNMADKVAKARQARGETSGHARLTEAAIYEIRAAKRGKCGAPVLKLLAEKFGVTTGHLSDIRAGRSWKHIKEGAA